MLLWDTNGATPYSCFQIQPRILSLANTINDTGNLIWGNMIWGIQQRLRILINCYITNHTLKIWNNLLSSQFFGVIFRLYLAKSSNLDCANCGPTGQQLTIYCWGFFLWFHLAFPSTTSRLEFAETLLRPRLLTSSASYWPASLSFQSTAKRWENRFSLLGKLPKGCICCVLNWKATFTTTLTSSESCSEFFPSPMSLESSKKKGYGWVVFVLEHIPADILQGNPSRIWRSEVGCW